MMGEGIDVTTWKWIMELLIGLALAVGVMLFLERARAAEWKYERLPGLAAELVRLKVDVIVAASPPATEAVRQATRTIPSSPSQATPWPRASSCRHVTCASQGLVTDGLRPLLSSRCERRVSRRARRLGRIQELGVNVGRSLFQNSKQSAWSGIGVTSRGDECDDSSLGASIIIKS